jgi:hypothetical protein
LTNKVLVKTRKSQSPGGKDFEGKISANSERPDGRKTLRYQPKMCPEGMANNPTVRVQMVQRLRENQPTTESPADGRKTLVWENHCPDGREKNS